ncbi:MAG: DUF2244 domain-containing protein [Oleiphilaceae bacterium]|nr:DUF2244 domain-containing protein [Oleiphilaceae bacterium]
MFSTTEERGTTRCVMQPNHSATWSQLRRVWLVLAVISALIAGIWAVQGAWMILPFAGLELALVYYLLRRVSARSYRQEVLEINEEKVSLVWGQRRPEGCWQGETSCTCLECWRPAHALSPPALFLRQGDRRVAVAAACPVSDCEQLLAIWQGLSLPVEFKGRTRVRPHQGFDHLE